MPTGKVDTSIVRVWCSDVYETTTTPNRSMTSTVAGRTSKVSPRRMCSVDNSGCGDTATRRSPFGRVSSMALATQGDVQRTGV
jgi:hypothetical protein